MVNQVTAAQKIAGTTPSKGRWTRLVCPNGHEEKVEEKTADLKWYCPECGARRTVEANYIEPENTNTDKI